MGDETLNDKEWSLVNFCEQEFLAYGQLPTADKVNALGLAGPDYWKKFLQKQVVRDSLVARGIPLQMLGGPGTNALTEEQLTAANVWLDLHDNRSQKKKLADLGISTQKWQAWLRDPAFQEYLTRRADNILGDNYHEANLALLGRIRSGDMSAVKFYYEVTGRYNPQRGDSVNVTALLMKIMEIIQKHVNDNEVTAAIADEFLTLASGVGIATQPQRAELPRVVDL